MSHLGDLTSALVDGELTGAELDRAHAHLAACAACRAEAAVVRRLKRELGALAEVDGAEALTRRLLAMPGSRDLRPGDRRPRDLPGLRDPLGSRPLLPRAQSGRAHRRRGRYVVLGVSLVVAGVGAAAFGMGGGGSPAERQITPQLEMFDMQHAVTSGDVPFAGAQKAGAQKAGAQKAGAQKAGAQKAGAQKAGAQKALAKAATKP